MATKILTSSRYYGKVCERHPEFGGLRTLSHHCVQCKTESTVKAAAIRYHKNPEFRQSKIDAAVSRKRLRGSRIPKWADLGKIREIYKEAQRLGLTVDHEIPIRGKDVCGLHVHYNLQLMSASANSSKGNDFPIKE